MSHQHDEHHAHHAHGEHHEHHAHGEHHHEEFHAEHPATEERVMYKTGEKVKDDGAYLCVNCVETDRPPMVNLTKGQMIPVCATCGPLSRWSHI